jgi:transposase
MSPVEEQLREEVRETKTALRQTKSTLRETKITLREQRALNADLERELKRQRDTIERMEHRMNDLLRRLYGRKSEKLDRAQLLMEDMILNADGEAARPEPPPAPEAPAKPARKCRHPGRAPLPDHLPRHEILLQVPEAQRRCPVTGEERPVIGYEETEKLEYIPETLRVNVYKREKLGSPMGAEEGGVTTAPMPPALVERCLADTGMLTHVAVTKFDDHNPLYRQERQLLRQGIWITRQTLAGWLRQMAEGLRPLWRRSAELILQSGVVHHDDTPVNMLDPGAGKTKQTRMWVALSGAGPPLAHFTFATDRSQRTPLAFFSGYTGALMCDEYAGYVNADCGPLLSCWAHARRHVEKAKHIEPAFALEVLRAIGRLYRIEKWIRRAPEETRKRARERLSRKRVEKIFALLESRTFRPKSPMDKAKHYILSHRKALTRYTEDPALPIDNNPVERALRRVAVGRRNWLFLGSETGGETAAILMSLLASCWANRVNARAYLKDVLDRLPTHPQDALDELLPPYWIEHHPEARLPDQNVRRTKASCGRRESDRRTEALTPALAT